MSLFHFRSIGTAILLYGLCTGSGAAAAGCDPLTTKPPKATIPRNPNLPGAIKKRKGSPTRSRLCWREAQRDIDKSNFEGGRLSRCRRLSPNSQNLAYAQFSIAVRLHSAEEKRTGTHEYETNIAIDPKISEGLSQPGNDASRQAGRRPAA